MVEITAWLKEQIVLERKGYDENRKKGVDIELPKTCNFLPPCQVLLLFFPEVNIQYLICTHNPDYDDLQITSKQIALNCTVEELDRFLSSSIWEYAIPEVNNVESLKLVLEKAFISLLKEIKNEIFTAPTYVDSAQKTSLTKTIFVWTIKGNLTNFKKLSDHIGKIDVEALSKTSFPTGKDLRLENDSQPPVKGYIALFLPHIWVGEFPRRTFKQKALSAFLFPWIALDQKYKNRIVIITRNGIIGIGEKNSGKAVKFLNEIMAVLLLSGIETTAITESDLGEAEFTPSMLKSWSITDKMSNSNYLEYPELDDSEKPITIVEKETICKLIDKAERLSIDGTLSDYLIFLLQAHTHKRNSEFTQCFILSWLIIEKNISWQWENFLREEGITRRRKDKLTNPTYWTIDFVLEALALNKCISQNEYENLMALKNRRNDIIHSGETPNNQETNSCYALAHQIIKERSGL